jgi:hypothetical protein
MSSASCFVSPQELWNQIGRPCAPSIPDVRRREVFNAARDDTFASPLARPPLAIAGLTCRSGLWTA